MQTVIPNVLIRSARPGWPNKDVDVPAVDAWIAEARESNVSTVLCLLSEKQLSYYPQLGEEGLLGRYRSAAFEVIHRPVEDHLWPPVPQEMLERISSDFLTATLPMLVHCAAGVDRTGAVVRHLTEDRDMPGFRTRVEELMGQHSAGRGIEHFRQVRCGHEITVALRRRLCDASVHGRR